MLLYLVWFKNILYFYLLYFSYLGLNFLKSVFFAQVLFLRFSPCANPENVRKYLVILFWCPRVGFGKMRQLA